MDHTPKNIRLDPPSISGFTIYTKVNCTLCDLVKELVYKNNPHAKVVPCDEYLCDPELKESFLTHINRKHIQKCSVGEYRTFPMVFFQGKFLGGYSDTVKHLHTMKEESNNKGKK
jgi:glutaredoxin